MAGVTDAHICRGPGEIWSLPPGHNQKSVLMEKVVSVPEIIAAKRRLARSLRAQAHQWEKRSYLPFIGAARRRVKVMCLRAEAKRQLQSAESLERGSKAHGPKLGDSLPGSI